MAACFAFAPSAERSSRASAQKEKVFIIKDTQSFVYRVVELKATDAVKVCVCVCVCVSVCVCVCLLCVRINYRIWECKR